MNLLAASASCFGPGGKGVGGQGTRLVGQVGDSPFWATEGDLETLLQTGTTSGPQGPQGPRTRVQGGAIFGLSRGSHDHEVQPMGASRMDLDESHDLEWTNKTWTWDFRQNCVKERNPLTWLDLATEGVGTWSCGERSF